MSLMGQDRTKRPNLMAVLRDVGLKAGARIGLVGWKYLEPEEWDGELPTFQASAFVVDVLKRIAGDPAAVIDATPVLMHPETGMRSVVDVHQIAAAEWGAARASAALWRIVRGVREGDTEYRRDRPHGLCGRSAERARHVRLRPARASRSSGCAARRRASCGAATG